MRNVLVLDHPLTRCWLTELRDEATAPERFRARLRALSVALFLEAMRDLPLRPHPVASPLGAAPGEEPEQWPLLAPVLRAGLGMASAILELVPECTVVHLGVQRDHVTLQPHWYHRPAPPRGACGRTVLVLDPMLATGGTAAAAVQLAREWGAAEVRVLAIVAAPEGLQAIAERERVRVFTAAVDSGLNEHGYIVPGLGDAGDRLFAT